MSLTALTEAELRRIVNDDRYRDLIRELLLRYSDGGGEVGNSSGYRESDLGYADSSSGTTRRRRGEDRGDCLSSSKTNCSSLRDDTNEMGGGAQITV